MFYKLSKFKKTIATLIIAGLFVSVLSLTSSKTVSATDGGAGWTFNAMWGTKEFGLDTAARFIARQMLSVTISTMIKKIQGGGRTGRSPSFIQDWRNFITDAQYRGEDVFRSILSQTVMCGNVSVDMRTIFRANNRPTPIRNTRTNNLNPFIQRARCSMPNNWNTSDFQRDFAGNGGWQALAKLSQPENNFYGIFLMSMGELAAQRAIDTDADIFEGTSAQGFTGIKLGTRGGSCDDPPTTAGQCIADPFGTGAPGTFCNNTGQACTSSTDCQQPNPSQARCTFLGKTYTPASLMGEATAQTIDKNIAWLITSDELSEVLVAIIGAVMDRLNNYMLAPKPDARAGQGAPDGSITDPYTQCVQDCNSQRGDAYGVCIQRCSDLDQGSVIPPTPIPTPILNACVPIDGNFATQVETAHNNVSNNTTLDEGNRERDIDADAFLDAVVIELRNMGLRAGRLDNGRVRGDTIIVGNNSDPLGHIYDVISSSCSPGTIGGAMSNLCMAQTEPWSSLRDPGAVSQSCGVFENPPIPQPVTQCSDGIDNDGDGLNNMADPECRYPSDNDESNGGVTGPSDTATFCVDPNFGGACDTFSSFSATPATINLPSMTATIFSDNSISSLRVSGTWTVTVCTDINFSGTCQNFNAGDFPDLTGTLIGDDITSIRSSP